MIIKNRKSTQHFSIMRSNSLLFNTTISTYFDVVFVGYPLIPLSPFQRCDFFHPYC